MTSLSENTVVTTSGGLVELGRVTKNTTSIAVTSSGVSVCGPLTVVCDGSPIVVEYYCPQTDAPGNAGSYIYFRLDEDGIEKTRYWAVNKNSAASPAGIPIYAKRVLTPSAGVHTYEVKAFVDSGTGYAYANTENSTTGAAPAFLRVSKIVQASQFIVPLASAPLVTSLPSTGNIDGQEVRYLVDDTNGTLWNLRWRASANRWEPISGFESDRNRIINGAMLIDERRRNSAANSQTDVFVSDRFRFMAIGGGNANVQTVTNDGPVGISTNSAKITVSTQDTSLAAGDYYIFRQGVEGYLTQDFGFGTSANKEITLSFYVKSSVIGTFGGCIKNSALNRSYAFSYQINAANTWERKIISLTADNTGTWEKTNNVGLYALWSLGHGSTYTTSSPNTWQSGDFNQPTGSTNLFNTASATWQLSGVQLELGPTATPFQKPSFAEELGKCQRYYLRHDGFVYFDGASGNSTVARGAVQFPCTMRAAPTIVPYSSTSLGGNANQVYVSNTNSSASVATPTGTADGFDTIGNASGLPGAYLYGLSYTATAEIS